ncbi:hypothetical protein CDAR_281551 [Caerostris darwini]|uniref:Uncharacterized protein n=1 Tax=Caerostris darwini TaxID=1538125 RepID=A0AAV4QXK0_9ARAC|nr:hypothetical protein CDAR_281551 [Caerostris darwini]
MALRVSQIQCAASEQGLLWNYLGRRWPFSPEEYIKWNSISTSPKQKKERKLQSHGIQMYSKMGNSSHIFNPPPNSISRPPPRDSVLFYTSSLIFGTSGKAEVKMGPLPVTLKS